MPIFDTHTHYMSSAFDEDREQLLSSLPQKDVYAVLDCGVDEETVRQSLAYGMERPWLYTAAGVHPEEVDRVGLQEVEAIVPFLKNPKVKAIGECGLDYYYTKENRALQIAVFERQLQLAKDFDMPMVIHNREAHQDTMELLKKYRPKGVLHCYSGSAEMAKEIIKLGLYISFTGVLTFANARRPVESLAEVPLHRLLMETDCPWMAPVPLRGKRSDSSMIVHTAAKAAALKGETTDKILDITLQNACALFSVPPPA